MCSDVSQLQDSDLVLEKSFLNVLHISLWNRCIAINCCFCVLPVQLPGLSKSRSSGCCPGPKTKTLGPARVSGLRRKAGSEKKISTSNSENKPRFQATISSLWKNFSFQK